MMLSGSDGVLGAFIGALFGLIFGSFIGMASWRWPLMKNWLTPSACTVCRTPLRARNLVPVFSWLLQRGRATCCGNPISPRYTYIELGMAALLSIVGYFYGLSPEFALLTILLTALVLLSVIDLACGLIPDGASLTVALAGLVWLALHPIPWWQPALSVAQNLLVGVGLAWGYARLRGREMLGWGDVKLMAASGLWLIPQGGSLYLSLGGFLGVAFGLIWQRSHQKEEFPFAPALALALPLAMAFQRFLA